MNWAEAIVLIVAVVSLAKMVSGRRRNHSAAQDIVPPPGPDQQALRREVEDLRERVRVLERIATDGRQSRDLADEIERLR